MTTIIDGKKSFFEKVKEHKLEIIIGGVTIFAIGAVLIVNNCGSIKNQSISKIVKDGIRIKNDIIPHVSETAQNAFIDIPSSERIVDVSKYARNLPMGQNASAEKLASAIQNGFDLGPHQTWVDAYSRSCA